MRSLLALDITQLNRLRSKIVELEARPPTEQARKQHLLRALRTEEESLRQYNRRLHATAGITLWA
jgi:hypothetical protein